MFFRNDDPGPLSEAEVQTLHRALSKFNTEDEVRFGEDIRILAPILNTLTANRRKFYLVHLPDGAGWVLRRNRPTGVFNGRTIPAESPRPPQPVPAPDHPADGTGPLADQANNQGPAPVDARNVAAVGDGQDAADADAPGYAGPYQAIRSRIGGADTDDA